MKYTGESCQWCGVAFDDGDDIVVCPDCAAPYHRECWHAHGHCALADKHGEGFVWQRAAGNEPAEEKREENAPFGAPEEVTCPGCGTVSPKGTVVCPNCGMPLAPVSFGGPAAGEAMFRPDFDPNERIGDVTSGDVAMFCRTGGARYTKAFRKLAGGAALGFNWAALFFTPFWFFYRKLYKAAAIFASVFIALNIWLIPVTDQVGTKLYEKTAEMQEALEPYQDAESEEADKAAEKLMTKYSGELYAIMRPMFLPAVLMLLFRLVSALSADRLYYRKCRKTAEEIGEQVTDARVRQLELFRRGGTSMLVAAVSYMSYYLIHALVTNVILG